MLCSGGTPARSRLGCNHILWALCGCGSSWWAGLCQRSMRSSATPWTRETSQSWVAGFLSPCTQSLVVAVQRFPIWGDVVLVFLSSSLCVSWRLVLVVSGAHSSDSRMFCLLFCTCFVECDWPGLHVRRHWLHLTGALGFFFFCAVSLCVWVMQSLGSFGSRTAGPVFASACPDTHTFLPPRRSFSSTVLFTPGVLPRCCFSGALRRSFSGTLGLCHPSVGVRLAPTPLAPCGLSDCYEVSLCFSTEPRCAAQA